MIKHYQVRFVEKRFHWNDVQIGYGFFSNSHSKSQNLKATRITNAPELTD